MRTTLAVALGLVLALAARAQDGSAAAAGEGGAGSGAEGSAAESGSAGAPDAKATFEQFCAKCHGADGKAQTKMGKKSHATNFTRPKWQARTTDDEIVKAITEGVVEKGKRLMPSFKEKVSADQVQALVLYLRAFGPPAAPAADKPAE